MKKLIKSGLIVIAVAAIAGYGTYSFFSDKETSSGNTFTAGSIDLTLGGNFSSENNVNGGPFVTGQSNDNRVLYNFADLKPGDQGEGSFNLQVTSNEAYVCAKSTITSTPDDTYTEAEQEAGDLTNNDGELQNYLKFATFDDENEDGVYQTTEPVNVGQYIPLHDNKGITAAELGAAGWVPVAQAVDFPNSWLVAETLPSGLLQSAGLLYCFGDFTTAGSLDTLQVTGCDGTDDGLQNQAQTDKVIGSIEFYAVQARNNDGFTCASLNTTNITANDLAENGTELAAAPNSWLFYNDTNDTIMPINQFSAGSNEMASVAGEEGAKMTLFDGNSRYNIATYRYKDVKLSDISSLKYRIYDASVSAETPYLHFNIDFFNTDTWQSRLVQVPTGIAVNTWTEVDALAGNWTYSGATWPAPISQPGSTPKTWTEIKTAYPNAETRSTDSFFGVRVGHPGPIGETGYVDWIELNNQRSDFEL